MPPTAVATIGSPQAAASSTLTGVLSTWFVFRKTSWAANSRALPAGSRKPTKATASADAELAGQGPGGLEPPVVGPRHRERRESGNRARTSASVRTASSGS